jgi:dihydropyrimidinase
LKQGKWQNAYGKSSDMKEILIKGGLIVNADATFRADVLVSGGKISRVADWIAETEDLQVIDASDKLVIPGGIDPHVHLALPTPVGCSCDDFVSGSAAALKGGTTTLIDFVTPGRGEKLTEALVERRRELGVGGRQLAVGRELGIRNSEFGVGNWELGVGNFGVHMGVTAWNSDTAAEMRRCVEKEGIVSFKVYLAYLDNIGIDYTALERIMETAASLDAIVAVHCEDGAAIAANIGRLRKEGKLSPGFHALSRPVALEAAAVQKVLELAAITGCRVYIVHVSCAMSLSLIAAAKQRGVQVDAETCPHYLLFDEAVYLGDDMEVLPFVLSPPIRGKSDQDALWKAISDGTLAVVSTDHCPFNLYGQKDIGLHDFTKVPNGTGGLEFRMALLYTYGVLQQRISLNQWVGLCSTHAANLFGMRHKGRIAEGMDADLVVWDPKHEGIISSQHMESRCDHTIYDGFSVQGRAETVILSGRICFQAR